MANGQPFHSWYGYSLGIPPQTFAYISNGFVIIDANVGNFEQLNSNTGNIGNLTVDNIILNGNLDLGPNATLNVGSITGNIKAPGADTQVMFNIGGNLSADKDFTWNPYTNFLHIMGNACFDGCVTANCFHGDGSNLTNVNSVTSQFVTSSSQPNITSLGNLTSLTVIGNSNLGNIANITIYGGNNGDVLSTYGNGTLYWNNGVSILSNGTSNVSIPSQNGPVLISANGYANIITVHGANLFSPKSNVIIDGELWTNGNVRADYFDGDGSRLSNINGANIVGLPPVFSASVVTSNNQPNITSVGNLTSLTVIGNTNLGGNGNVIITGGNAGDVLTTDGTGNLYWSNTPINNTIVDGSSNVLVYPNSNIAFTVSGNSNVVVFTATGSNINGYSNITGDLSVGNNATISNNLTVNNNVNITNNLTVNGNSYLGSNGNVFITGGLNGQVLSTDGLGNLSWITTPNTSIISNGISNVSIPNVDGNIELTVNGNTSVIVTENGIQTGNIIANNISVNNLSFANTLTGNFNGYFTGNVVDTYSPYPGYILGYREVPQRVITNNVVLDPEMSAKHLYTQTTFNLPLDIDIYANSNVQFNLGTEIKIVNGGTSPINVNPITTFAPVQLYFAGTNFSGTRTILPKGMATLMKVDTDTWFIYGDGII